MVVQVDIYPTVKKGAMRKKQDFELGNDMGSIIWMIPHRSIGEQIVKPLWIAAQKNTQEEIFPWPKACLWELPWVQTRVMGKEGEKRNLDPGMVKNPADANSKHNQTRECPFRAVSVIMIDLLTNH